MKKSKAAIIIFIFLFGVLLFILLYKVSDNIGYDIGKDTVDIFSDGEYKILKAFNKDNGSFMCLTSDKYGQIIYLVNDYKQDGNYILFKGTNFGINGNVTVFAVLNSITNVIRFCPVDTSFEDLGLSKGQEMVDDGKLIIINSIDEFSENEKEILLSL